MEDYVARLTGIGGSPAVSTPLAASRSISPSTGNEPKSQFSPHSYTFWLALAVAGAVGLASVSGSIRVGPIKASGSVG